MDFIGNLLDNKLNQLLEKYIDNPWNWSGISYNLFNKDPDIKKIIEKKIQCRKECYNIMLNYCISDISYLISMYL